MTIDWSRLSDIDSISGEDSEETEHLRALYGEARRFLEQFHWHRGIKDAKFGFGVGGIVGVFLVEVVPSSPKVDRLLWVIVGDLPPAYLVTDDAPEPARALEVYIQQMRRWVEAVRARQPTTGIIPVNAPATIESATDLERRLLFLEQEILPRQRAV